MVWKKVRITDETGEMIEAQAPVIVSASRSTDIPAFYAEWFIDRLKKGYLAWKNPFNGKKLYVSFEKTRVIVFWTKNPRPLLRYIDALDSLKLNYYFQFTLNDYVLEGYEPCVPSVESRIDTFRELSERLGSARVIWRFDPLMLSNKVTVKQLLEKVEHIGDQLKGYTERFVFSFADIAAYATVQKNLLKRGLFAREFVPEEMEQFARGICELNREWGFRVSTCAETIDLSAYGIDHNRCVDDQLLRDVFSSDTQLMEFLGYNEDNELFEDFKTQSRSRNLKDKGQRKACGCIVSKDIGAYNTCPHLCAYCYANADNGRVLKNYATYLSNKKKNITILP